MTSSVPWNKMMKLCILFVCVLKVSAQNATSDPTQTDTPTETPDNNETPNSETPKVSEVDTTTTETPNNNETPKASDLPEASNGQTELPTVADSNVNATETVATKLSANGTINSIDAGNETVLSADAGNITAAGTEVAPETTPAQVTKDVKSSNETFFERVKEVAKRLFKREIVGSLARRTSQEIREEQKITVPMILQKEYYLLRKRKEEIERNKNVFRNEPNKSIHEELIQNTWDNLVNWSKDHLAFEDKVIKIAKIKTHANIQHSKKDSDATDDSEDKLASVDSDEDSDKSMRPEFATVKNLAEVNDRYKIEKNIEELEKKIKDNPEEDNEKNRLLLEQYRHELKTVDFKYDKIRAMKINRKMIEEVWHDKKVLDKTRRKAENAVSDEDI